MRRCYVPKNFRAEARHTIAQANEICREYADAGYELTLRQLYYQFVARGLIANRQSEYNKLGSIINDARLAGKLDWNYIVDRTRNLQTIPHWNSPEQIVRESAEWFAIDKWKNQPRRVEVWIEKDALLGVIEPICREYDVPYFSCRGYTSQSEVYGAAQRIFKRIITRNQSTTILHLGDHDPSGIDMSRDILDRLMQFLLMDYLIEDPDGQWDDEAVDGLELWKHMHDRCSEDALYVHRIALNMDQIKQYEPPPNPAKFTDSRAAGYVEKFGHESWELDALPPNVLHSLIESQISSLLDEEEWDVSIDKENEHRNRLKSISQHWDSVVDLIDEME